MRARLVLILIGLTVLWGLLLTRAAFLQLIPNERLRALERRQFETVVTLNPRRGDILDRNGNELAVSMTTYSLFADPKIVKEPKKVARILARELRKPVKAIEEKLRQRNRRFVWIERQLKKETRDAISEHKIRGLGFIEESQRIYPNERLLSHVLGFVGGEGQGLEGLELYYNDQLQADSKRVNVRRDARGRPLIVNGQMFNQVPDGNEISLTIDRELQFIVEQELAEAVQNHQADSAVAVVLDAQTSEILAMAASPGFDPNHPLSFSSERRRNRPITDTFEPGSTMKTFLIAGALSRGLIEPNTKFDCEGGKMKIGRRVIRESDSHHRFGLLTVNEVLAVSSNVCSAKIAFKLGAQNLLETLHAFGFGEKLGVDLPGEAKGIIQPRPWGENLLASVSIGHGMTATPLQIANAYAAIANGGWLKRPYLVKSIHDRETGEVIEVEPKIIRRVLTDEQAAKMRIMLTSVTSDFGTGKNARVPGYPVAGKTGTAQKVNPNGRGYLPGGYISSFAGFLPANDPKFVIYVAVDHPRKAYYGSAVAAPVFSRIARFAVRRVGLPPVLITQEHVMPKTQVADIAKKASSARASADADPILADSVVPDLSGLTLREVMNRVTGTEIRLQVRGQGFVTSTSPPPGARISKNKVLTVYLER